MSIKVQGVTKLYGEQKALDEVSFSISKGEVVGLLGPNGAGKSTMMKILTCFIPPSEGNAEVNGYNIFDQEQEVRKQVGYLPENNPVYTDMYVRENLEFFAGIHNLGNKKSRIEEIIDLTGLRAESHKKIGQLSKGYRQRVGIAQALIHDPQVLILDEPTSGLDPNQLVDIRKMIKNIGKDKTVILSTHIMQEVEAVCDRAIIIHKGKIVADDSTGELHMLNKKAAVVIVEFDKPADKHLLLKIDGISSAEQLEVNTWQIIAESEKDVRSDIFQFAVDNKLKVLSMQKKDQSLEDIFHELTM
ncbi:MAG: gliding motility-associated ABC transporter ATP-binding subunit GldA [Bacteroidales bacterium]|nr:gliding motility-associated ABC transporter ATP-binding subunit GldA [Bacteroidales bacterium]